MKKKSNGKGLKKMIIYKHVFKENENLQVCMFTPFPPSVLIWQRLAKLSILILKGIIKKKIIWASRLAYESVDEKSLS